MDDLTLLRRYVRFNDHAAVALLVRKHQDSVRRLCLRRLTCSADAEDATQEVFLTLFRSADTINSNVGGWLYSCAANVSTSMLRSRKCRQDRDRRRGNGDAGPAPDDQAARGEILAILRDCLGQLDPTDREVLVQNLGLRVPQSLIASSLGISQQAVAKRIGRASDLLRGKLVRRGVSIPLLAAMVLRGRRAYAAIKVATTSLVGKSAAAVTSLVKGAGVVATSMLVTVALVSDGTPAHPAAAAAKGGAPMAGVFAGRTTALVRGSPRQVSVGAAAAPTDRLGAKAALQAAASSAPPSAAGSFMINPVAGKNGLSGSNSLVWMPPAAHLPPPAPKEDLWAGADPTSGLMLHSAIGLKSWHKTSVRLPGGAGPAQSGLAGEHGPRWTREADDASGDPAAPAMHPGEEADHDSDRLARESPAMRPPPGQADGPIVLAVAAPGTAGRPEMMSAGFRRPGVLASARPHEGAASTDIAGYNLHPIREAPSASVRANSPGASTAISIAVSIPPAARSPALPILLLFHAGQTRYEGAPSFGPPSLDGSMADGTDDGLDGGLSKSLPAVPQRDTRYKKLVVGGMDDSVGSVAVERLYYPPGPVMTATPEPATCCLLACALACGLPRRRGGKLVARASRP